MKSCRRAMYVPGSTPPPAASTTKAPREARMTTRHGSPRGPWGTEPEQSGRAGAAAGARRRTTRSPSAEPRTTLLRAGRYRKSRLRQPARDVLDRGRGFDHCPLAAELGEHRRERADVGEDIGRRLQGKSPN